jgi:hypothetical protein
MEVWAGLRRGSIRVEKDRVVIHIPNERQQRILKNAKFIINLDATATREKR